MARLRTFIAVDIGKPIRDRAVALQDKLVQSSGAVKWVEPENLHVTLLFLGEVEDREVPTICRVVAEQAQQYPAFPLSIERVGCFPNARRPRILWIGVGQGAQELCAVHDGLEPPLLELGCYRREERKYTPHITLGRVKGERPVDQLAAALAKHAGCRAGRRWQTKSS
jgi:2'-5' RNA ligase